MIVYDIYIIHIYISIYIYIYYIYISIYIYIYYICIYIAILLCIHLPTVFKCFLLNVSFFSCILFANFYSVLTYLVVSSQSKT